MAKGSLLAYSSLQDPNYLAPQHIQLVAKALNRVARGKTKRLIICMPPRHGKSHTCSTFFPAWYLGQHPEHFIITATYAQELADDFGRKVRNQVGDVLYRKIFPGTVMDQDSRAMHRFSTNKGGAYYAVGAGGPITGRGAHLLLVDDIFKNREEADSETVRTSRIEWYKSTAYTRLMPGGSIVMVSTRWHEEDLIGYVLKEHAHEGWETLILPAEDEKGHALWEDRYPLDVLKQTRMTLGEYDYSCLYQQNPVPLEGGIFKTEWLNAGESNDGYAATFMAMDLAISKKETADETAITVVKCGYEKPCKFYEVETLHGKWDFNQQINVIMDLKERHKPQLIGVESTAYQKAMADVLSKLGLPVVELPADQDKVRRAMTVQYLFTQGRVAINSPDLKQQMMRFRGDDGGKDDLVDAIVHCLRLAIQNSAESYEIKKDRYKDLDPRSRRFWRDHDEQVKELHEGSNRNIDYRKIYGL